MIIFSTLRVKRWGGVGRRFGEVLYERYNSDITDSPISRNDYEAEVGIGFIYVF
ncbi:MipA/OmpV family protein [Pseudidiomarina sp. E22-M8]|uniref:MipA/OmpV family protein n=1 Tax=Pseudidiomarina sp. E22-M8 TaxID=3424768 RepID=UPI00403CFA53